MIEMIKNSDKFRGYDFSMDSSKINNKNLFYKIEITMCIKLSINKFKTFYELHEYFKNI